MLMVSFLLKYLSKSFSSCTSLLLSYTTTGEQKENPVNFWSPGLLTPMHNEMMMFPRDIYGLTPDFRAPASIPALTTWLHLLPQYHAKPGPHTAVRDISWGNACVLSLPGRKRSRAFAHPLCLPGTAQGECSVLKGRPGAAGWKALLHPVSITSGVSPSSQTAFPLHFAGTKWKCLTISALSVPWFRIYSGSSVMVKSPSLLYELYGFFRHFRPVVITFLLLKPVETFLST